MPKRNFILPALLLLCANSTFAGDADIQLPSLDQLSFFHGAVTAHAILFLGLFVCAVGAAFGILEYVRTRALPVHRSMSDVSQIIWETCKTYLFQQGKFLAALWLLIAVCMASRDAQYISVAPNHDPRVPASTMPQSDSPI